MRHPDFVVMYASILERCMRLCLDCTVVGTCRYCLPRHRMPFNISGYMVSSALDDAAHLEPSTCCLPRHRIPDAFDSRKDGSKFVSMTWRATSWPYTVFAFRRVILLAIEDMGVSLLQAQDEALHRRLLQRMGWAKYQAQQRAGAGGAGAGRNMTYFGLGAHLIPLCIIHTLQHTGTYADQGLSAFFCSADS